MKEAPLKRIWDAIPWGEPLDARVISEAAGVDPGRTCETVRSAVAKFRDHGFPIVSSRGGFYKTTSPKALAVCAKDLFDRAHSMQIRGCRLLALIEQEWAPPAYEEDFSRCFGL